MCVWFRDKAFVFQEPRAQLIQLATERGCCLCFVRVDILVVGEAGWPLHDVPCLNLCTKLRLLDQPSIGHIQRTVYYHGFGVDRRCCLE